MLYTYVGMCVSVCEKVNAAAIHFYGSAKTQKAL